MNKYRLILIDTLILCVVSSVFAYLFNTTANALKGKAIEDDPIVTAIIQANLKDLEAAVAKHRNATNRIDEQGRSALMRAAYANFADAKTTAETDDTRVAMVELLVKQGAEPDALDHDGWSALMWASWSGLDQVASKLLELGASQRFADKQGNTALIIAAQRGKAGIVQLLLAKGADPTLRNHAGKTACAAAMLGMEQYPERQAAYREVLAALR
jgi:ankyrin repeat protein